VSDRTVVAALSLIAAVMLLTYFLNRPHADMYPDSANYLQGASGLLQGHVFSTERLPGYPLFLLVLGATTGFYGFALFVQGLIYLGSVAVTYYVVRRAFGVAWIAGLAGLMMATDPFAASYAKTLLSETLAMGLVAGFVVTSFGFVRAPRVSTLWLMALLATLAALTRPEWAFFGLAAALYLGAFLWRQGILRRYAWHGLGALVATYLVIGGYVAGNAVVNGYAGTTEITNLSLLGKVMQYRMQDEAPASWASTTQLVDAYVANGRSVWTLVGDHPELRDNHYGQIGAYARAVILRDPVRFAWLSVDIAVRRSADFDPQFATITRGAAFDKQLRLAEFLASARYFVLYLTPVLALMWLVVPFFRPRDPLAALGPAALVVAYGTAITALGGFDEYGRYHVVFIPAVVALVWGTLGLNLQAAIASRSKNRRLMFAAIAVLVLELVLAEAFPFLPVPNLLLDGLFLVAQSGLLLVLLAEPRHVAGQPVVALDPAPPSGR